MKLPNADKAIVPRPKIVDYLLSESNPDGRDKASFFIHFGFTQRNWQELANALVKQAEEFDIKSTRKNKYGISYTIEGEITTPSGRSIRIRSVWFIDDYEEVPRLSTAYPE